MKIKDITYTLKKGLPNYSSVSAGMTIEVTENDNLDEVWDKAKKEVERQCNEDQSWLNEKS